MVIMACGFPRRPYDRAIPRMTPARITSTSTRSALTARARPNWNRGTVSWPIASSAPGTPAWPSPRPRRGERGGPAVPGIDPECGLGLPEARGLARTAKGAGQRQLQPPAERVAVDGGDARLAEGLESKENRLSGAGISRSLDRG